MNWFVKTSAEDVAKPAPAAPASFMEGAKASWANEAIRRDLWGKRGDVEWSFLEPMAKQLLEPQYHQRFHTSDPLANPTLQRLFGAAAQMQDRPADWPTSWQDLSRMVDARLRAELQDTEAIMRMAPWASATTGAMARGATSPFGFASMAIPGGVALKPLTFLGGVARAAAVEGAIGAVDATIGLAERNAVADQLGIDRPDAVTEILMGGAGGLVIGGALGAATRGLANLAGVRNVDPPPPGVSLGDHLAASNAAERALASGEPLPSAPPSTMDLARRIAQVESSGDPLAANPNSTAFGAGQFVKGTWLELIRRHRPALARDKSEAEILALRADPQLSQEMIAVYANQNLQSLMRAGVPQERIGQGELHLAHFVGPGGAARLLKADTNTPVSDLLGADAIVANERVLKGKTAGEVIAWAHEKIGAPPRPPPRQTLGSAAAFQEAFPRVTAASGQSVDVRWEIADLDKLQAATGDLQPRDRAGRLASSEQIAEIAARLEPARLLPSPEASRGAPIVGPDDIVESGNGRVAALRRAIDVNPDAYVGYRERLRSLGFEVEGVERPILIGRRLTPFTDEERRAFVVGANSADVMRMSPAEQARVDADAISPGDLEGFESMGALFGRDGEGFVQRFMDGLPQAERAQMDAADGRLSIAGEDRLRNAVFAKAFDDPVMLRAMTETGAEEAQSMMRALSEAAPPWARLRQSAKSGDVRAEYDVTTQIADALQTVAKARRQASAEGRSVATVLREALDQGDMFGGGRGFISETMVSHGFYNNGRARAAGDVAELLRNYARLAETMGDTRPRLFDDGAGLSPEATFSHALRQTFGDEVAPPPPAALELFDAGAQAPAARTAMDSEEIDLRRLIQEAGEDFEVPDGAGGMMRISEALDEGRAWEAAAETVKFCRPKG